MSHLERIFVAARLEELYNEWMSLGIQRLIFVPGEEQESILDGLFLGQWNGGRKNENERWVSRLGHFSAKLTILITVPRCPVAT